MPTPFRSIIPEIRESLNPQVKRVTQQQRDRLRRVVQGERLRREPATPPTIAGPTLPGAGERARLSQAEAGIEEGFRPLTREEITRGVTQTPYRRAQEYYAEQAPKPSIRRTVGKLREIDRTTGQVLAGPLNPVTERVPGGRYAQAFAEEALRPTSLAAMAVPFVRLSSPLKTVLANVALQGGANTLQDLALGRTDPKELGLSFGIGGAFGASPQALDALKAGARAAGDLAATPEGQRILREAASERGSLKLGDEGAEEMRRIMARREEVEAAISKERTGLNIDRYRGKPNLKKQAENRLAKLEAERNQIDARATELRGAPDRTIDEIILSSTTEPVPGSGALPPSSAAAPAPVEAAPRGGLQAAADAEGAALSRGEGAPPVEPPQPPTSVAPTPPSPPSGTNDVLALTERIRTAKKLRPEQQRAFATERKQRAGRVGGILEGARGDEAFQRAQGSLKGEFEGHATFEPPVIDDAARLRMVEEIRTTDKIRPFEKLNAKNAFDKVMSGRLPEPAELEKLERVFGPEFSQAVLEKAPASWLETIVDIATLPKSALTTFDLSFPLRQGIVLAPSQPKAWLGSWKPMIKAFGSEKNTKLIDDAMRADPLFGRFADGEGYTAPLTRTGARAQREESLVSRFVDVIPGVRNSARAFITFGNQLRFQAWKNLVKGFEGAEGLDAIDAGFAKFVNHATGRGDVPFRAGEVLPGLSAFFSLRNFVSRFQLLADPALVKNVPMMVRAKMALDISKFFGAGITFLGMIKVAHDRGVPGFEDVTVEHDPRSVDFGKLRIGDRRYDMWGGYQSIARYMAQIQQGERLAELPDESKAVVGANRKQVFGRFIESKLDPTLGLAVALWRGESYLGKPINADRETLRRELWDRAVPLFVQDLAQSVNKYGPAGAAFAIPGAFGASIQDYETSEGQKQYAMKQVLPGRLNKIGFPSVERGFASEYWKSRLPAQTVDPRQFETWEDYRMAYIDHWTTQRPPDISEAMARDLAARKFDSFDAVKAFQNQRNEAELQFWIDHPDLLQQAIDANLEDVSKEKLEILEEAIPR